LWHVITPFRLSIIAAVFSNNAFFKVGDLLQSTLI
jgi:hypothetical protein